MTLGHPASHRIGYISERPSCTSAEADAVRAQGWRYSKSGTATRIERVQHFSAVLRHASMLRAHASAFQLVEGSRVKKVNTSSRVLNVERGTAALAGLESRRCLPATTIRRTRVLPRSKSEDAREETHGVGGVQGPCVFASWVDGCDWLGEIARMDISANTGSVNGACELKLNGRFATHRAGNTALETRNVLVKATLN